VSFAAITLCVAFQRAISKVIVHFVMYSVRKLLDTPPYMGSVVEVMTTNKSIVENKC
jgi:hypothetical protein